MSFNYESKREMNKTLIQWQVPEAVRRKASEEQLKGCWGKVVRVMIIATTLAAAVYFAMSNLPVEDNLLKKGLLFGMLLAFLFALGMSIFSFIIYPYLIRFFRQTFALTEKGIKHGGNKNGFYHWKGITDYSIEESADFPRQKTLAVTFAGYKKYLPLSDDFPLDKALVILSTSITKQTAKLMTKLSFSKSECIYISIFLLVCTILFGYYLADIIRYLNNALGDNGALVFLLVFLLIFLYGPGTLVILQLKGFKSFKSSDAFLWAGALNMSFLSACMVFGAYIELYKILN